MVGNDPYAFFNLHDEKDEDGGSGGDGGDDDEEENLVAYSSMYNHWTSKPGIHDQVN